MSKMTQTSFKERRTYGKSHKQLFVWLSSYWLFCLCVLGVVYRSESQRCWHGEGTTPKQNTHHCWAFLWWEKPTSAGQDQVSCPRSRHCCRTHQNIEVASFIINFCPSSNTLSASKSDCKDGSTQGWVVAQPSQYILIHFITDVDLCSPFLTRSITGDACNSIPTKPFSCWSTSAAWPASPWQWLNSSRGNRTKMASSTWSTHLKKHLANRKPQQ